MSKHYFDKTGKEIYAGMVIQHDNGDIEMVYDTIDYDGDNDLGIQATSKAYLKYHPNCEIEYYSLAAFNMNEWLIVQEPEN